MIDNDASAGWMDRTAVGGQDALLLIGRVLLAAIFLQSGFSKLMGLGGFIAGLENQGVPMAAVLGTVGACVEFFGALAILLGAWARFAALLVAGFTVAATLIAHRYWDAAPDAMAMQRIQFMKNIAIVGGLLMVMASGAGRYSADGFRNARH